jgi:Na+/melibiose symporter-like transporter
MIITCKKEVPFRWIAFAILPWASFTFNGGVVGVVFFFSLKKFIENPAGLTFILSLPGFVSIVLQPVVSFLSDRIWTRFGRRRPFVMTSQAGVAVCLTLMPLMPNFWCLLAVFMLNSAFSDLNSPMEPLKQEIIPPQERGRATGAMAWCSNLATLLFYFIALGRFDDVTYIDGFPLNGETAIYWSAALLIFSMLMLVMLGIHEVDQKSALRGQRLTIRTFFGGLTDRELWPVYLLVVGSSCLNFYSGLGPLSNLLYTDQWGYTKQEMGINVAIGGVFNIFAIGLLTIFADRLNRMRAYQTLICLSLTCQVAYYSYINFVLPDKRPSLVEIIVFGETLSILGILTGLIYTPLVYDYVRRNKMGTFNAGASLVNRLTVLITLNGVGLFVWGYAMLFQPPAGDMTRVVLTGGAKTKAEVLQVLRASTWSYPGDKSPAPSSQVNARAWQGDGTVADAGRCWEVRLRDATSEKLEAQEEKLQAENSPLLAREKMLRDQAAISQRAGRLTEAAAETQKAADEESHITGLNARIDALQVQLATRAENFHGQVVRALGPQILPEGAQILGGSVQPAEILELATTHRSETNRLEQALAELRRERPDVIDLRPLKRDQGYGLAVSALLGPGDESAFEHDLQDAVERVAGKTDPGLFAPNTPPLGHDIQPALTLDLMVIEQPVNPYVSPITRLVNAVLGLFHDAPDPARRLNAMARILRVPTETNQVQVDAAPGARTISITALLPATASKAASAGDGVGKRLQVLLGPTGSGDVLFQARAFYDRIEKAAATQRITVARPTLATGYAPIQYDYMSGYLWMFVMGSLGILITLAFTRAEARGLIQKRGVEEARES